MRIEKELKRYLPVSRTVMNFVPIPEIEQKTCVKLLDWILSYNFLLVVSASCHIHTRLTTTKREAVVNRYANFQIFDENSLVH